MSGFNVIQAQEAALGLRFMRELPAALREPVADLIVRVSEARSVPGHARFLHENESVDDKGFVLVEGSVVIRREDRPEVVCNAPELLGEMQQFNPTHRRTATVATLTPCIVLRFHWPEFWAALDRERTPEEVAAVRKALQDQAWEHFTE